MLRKINFLLCPYRLAIFSLLAQVCLSLCFAVVYHTSGTAWTELKFAGLFVSSIMQGKKVLTMSGLV